MLFTSIQNGHNNVVIPGFSFEMIPGSSKVLDIDITPQIDGISDVLNLKSTNVNLTIPISINENVSLNMPRVSPVHMTIIDGTLKVHNAPTSVLRIYNNLGQVVALNDIQSNFTEINVADLNSGVYFVHIVGVKSGQIVQKILIP